MSLGKKPLLPRVDRRLLALSAAAAAGVGVVGVTQDAEAAIVYSGPVNLNIPSTSAGIYLNVGTGVSATTPAGAPGWDINPWGAASWNVWGNNAADPANSDGVVQNFTGGNSATLVDNLPVATVVDNSWSFGRTAGTETAGATAFVPASSNNYFGFRFWNEVTSQVNFGWGHVSFGTTTSTQPRTLIDYAYDNSGAAIAVGAQGGGTTPEPASLGLLAVGAVGLMRRRNRA